MAKLLVYSHDTYGLGNIRRMLAICHHLHDVIPDLSILLITGSPVIHSLRLPEMMDYIKLPCLTRVERGEYQAKYLHGSLADAVQLRSDLILTVVKGFQPDICLIDKKPMGVKGELAASLEYLHTHQPETRLLLVLRDILDQPEAIISNWHRNGHYQAIEQYYEKVLVLGDQAIFDTAKEYQFPPPIEAKTVYCGYLRKALPPVTIADVRAGLQILPDEKFVLVTTGGGQDGYDILATYLQGIASLQNQHKLKSVLVTGPELPRQQKAEISRLAASNSNVSVFEFRPDILNLMAGADAVITMSGYNTVCELISLQKSAVVIPRVKPTAEQQMRAERLSAQGFFQMIYPQDLTADRLMHQLALCLANPTPQIPAINLEALPTVQSYLESIL